MLHHPQQVIYITRPLEISITHACNLSCFGCLHYSDHKHTRFLSLQEVHDWLEPWSQIVQPRPNVHNSIFNILGGEPTLHKQLCEILCVARQYFPHCDIRLTTNGFYLKNHPKLEQVLYDNNITLKISIHSTDPLYLDKCNDSLILVKEWKKRGIKVEWAELYKDYWQIPYQIDNGTIKPYQDNDPRASWESCPCRCYQIFEKQIWKCSRIAYLKPQIDRYPDIMHHNWLPYLNNYQPLSLDSTYAHHKKFFQAEEEQICGMCPKQINYTPRTNLPSPLKTSQTQPQVDTSKLVILEDLIQS